MLAESKKILRFIWRLLPSSFRRLIIPIFNRLPFAASVVERDEFSIALDSISRKYDIVFLCNDYPHLMQAKYSPEFLRHRVKAYEKQGLDILVVCIKPHAYRLERQGRSHVIFLLKQDIDRTIEHFVSRTQSFVVHSPRPETVNALLRFAPNKNTVYFYHGFDIRDYRRLAYNYSSIDIENWRSSIEKDKKQRENSMAKIIKQPKSKIVFVSNYLKKVAIRDTGLDLDSANVIPNYIDTDFFIHFIKKPEHRNKILLIRSFSATNYANDVAIKAINILLKENKLNLSFTIRGFGRLFESMTRSLVGRQNVDLKQGVLTSSEIRDLHKEHGIFLAPTRYDTQGVSMGEAMSSGLVPVSHRIAAIPEFSDDSCAELANSHDSKEYAYLIQKLVENPDVFLKKSKAAAEKVRSLCGAPVTIDKEIDLILESQSFRNDFSKIHFILFEGYSLDQDAIDVASITLKQSPQGAILILKANSKELVIQCPPLNSCSYIYSDQETGRGWLEVVDKIKALIPPNAINIIPLGSKWIPLVLLLKKHHALKYVLVEVDSGLTLNNITYSVLSNAHALSFAKGFDGEQLRQKYIGPFREVVTSEIKDGTFKFNDAKEEDNGEVPSYNLVEGKKRILIVAYFAGNCSAVGVARVNYWFENLDRLSNGQTETHLATSILPEKKSLNYHHIPDYNGLTLTEDIDFQNEWSRHFVAREKELSQNFSTLSYFWRIELERYFESNDLTFDTVIISGNPFCCFEFGAFVKRKWGAQLMLDYRDPFANNPVMLYSEEARAKARYEEVGYNFMADQIIAVNKQCLKLIVPGSEGESIVIPNGFDENLVNKITSKNPENSGPHFIHAGSFNNYRRPEKLINSISDHGGYFHHIGRKIQMDVEEYGRKSLIEYGVLPYMKTLEIISGSDCGVIFSSSHGFESTTKLYDYLAFNLDVLVVEPENAQRGFFHELSQANGKVHLCKNEPEEIKNFLSEYKSSKEPTINVNEYSRESSTLALLDHLLFKEPN